MGGVCFSGQRIRVPLRQCFKVIQPRVHEIGGGLGVELNVDFVNGKSQMVGERREVVYCLLHRRVLQAQKDFVRLYSAR